MGLTGHHEPRRMVKVGAVDFALHKDILREIELRV
jgi:hypothetical protein